MFRFLRSCGAGPAAQGCVTQPAPIPWAGSWCFPTPKVPLVSSWGVGWQREPELQLCQEPCQFHWHLGS